MKKPKNYLLSTRARTTLFYSAHRHWDFPSMPDNWMPRPQWVAKFKSRELLLEPNFGKETLKNITRWLKKYQLSLADHD